MNRVQLDPQICKYLPTWYKPVEEYQQICQTETAQLEALAAAIHAVKENFYFQTMNLAGVEMWEDVLRIIPNPSTEDLDFRRARVLNRITTKPPFTLGFLYQKLDELIGPGEWSVTVDYANYTLYIESAAQNFNYSTEVAFTINRIKPAHIVFVSAPYIKSGLLMSETIEHALRTYNYHLGTWALGKLPFATDTDLGAIKMHETPSIQPALLNGTAAFVLEDIASARINGATAISAISKSQEGSTVTVSYTVTEAMAASVEKVELLDSEGNVLTSSTVYIPVSGSILLKHTIPVAEGVLPDGD